MAAFIATINFYCFRIIVQVLCGSVGIGIVGCVSDAGGRGQEIACRWVGDSGAYRGDGWETVGGSASEASRKE